MSSLRPGGQRSVGGRVFTASGIKRMIEKHHPDYGKNADNSLAGKPHENRREIERNQRRAAREEAKRNGR